jgi:uncharacterized UBP type Zn finger protein
MMPHSQGQGQSSGYSESKVQRLMEMGFERNSVVQALVANSDNEEAALNGLLSGNVSEAPPPQSSAAATGASEQQQAGGGVFSRLWGK